jgi:hypothetical protein
MIPSVVGCRVPVDNLEGLSLQLGMKEVRYMALPLSLVQRRADRMLARRRPCICL